MVLSLYCISLLLLELILKIFTVLNSIEISQGVSNTDSGSRKRSPEVKLLSAFFLYISFIIIFI